MLIIYSKRLYFLFLESGFWDIVARGIRNPIQLKESGIPQTTGIQNASSTDEDLESSTCNQESKTVLDSRKTRGAFNKYHTFCTIYY